MTTLNDIRAALEGHLSASRTILVYPPGAGAWDDATPTNDPSFVPAVDIYTQTVLPEIAWPNVAFTRVTGTPFMRAEFIPVLRRPVVAGPNPEQRHSGLFYVTIFVPESLGSGDGFTYVDRLLDSFAGSDAVITDSAIVRLEYGEAKMPLHDPPFFAIPVEIGWYAYAS